MTTNQDRAAEVIYDHMTGADAWPTALDGRDADDVARDAAQALVDAGLLAPDPQPRTLADTEWDDNVHPYMEAVTVSGRRHILLAPMGDTAVSGNTILVAEHDGGMPVLVPAEYLFPTGRYARLSLPDEHPNAEEDVSIIPPKIDTSTGHDDHVDMTPEDVPAGEAWIVECYGDCHVGTREQHEAPCWALARMDGTDVTFAGDHLVTLVSRLVPEVEA